ncbi:hypothetical protein Milano_090 [Agrobacterium phage Milano]|nr:hypothetical protein Milano_090 [Agrobacterium phage Milano]
MNRSYGLKTLTAKLFIAELRNPETNGSICEFELAYSRPEAFRNLAKRMSGYKIVSFRGEDEMSRDELEQARDWRSAGAVHHFNNFAQYGEMQVYHG